jgi:hypothetical protein
MIMGAGNDSSARRQTDVRQTKNGRCLEGTARCAWIRMAIS